MAETAEAAGAETGRRQISGREMLLVVAASAAGTAFEWYDFFVFVPLASIIAKVFAGGLSDAGGYVFALGSFAAGFAFRPVGALIFGRIGDRAGRKGAFLVTVSLMGLATFAIGLLPTYAQVGVIAPIIFIGLRILQGIALGGEYGGAAIYVAEHAPAHRRGFFTSWIQTSAAVGLTAALLVTLVTRNALGEVAFNAWGWRIPFLASLGLLAISLWIRLKLHESPTFQRMQAEGGGSKAPYREAFGTWSNLKRVLTALFAMMVAQGAVWYCAFFYAQTFIERVVKVPGSMVNIIMIAVVVCSAPLYVLFGWLSDKWGRKVVMTSGIAFATILLFPGFHAIVHAANPALDAAQKSAPVTLSADPKTCSLQFDIVGKAKVSSACDVAKSTLAAAGVSYRIAPAPAGAPTTLSVGKSQVAVQGARAPDPAQAAAAKAADAKAISAALRAAGYPASADPAQVDTLQIIGILLVFAVGATALYGPMAAALVEMFPTRIRYTALSLPYHIGTGWVGGFLPATAYAMVVASGDIYFGLWYPVIGGAISVLACLFLLKETRGRDLDTI